MYYPFRESAPVGLTASQTLSGAALTMFLITVTVAAIGVVSGLHGLFLIAALTTLSAIGFMAAKTAGVLSAPTQQD